MKGGCRAAFGHSAFPGFVNSVNVEGASRAASILNEAKAKANEGRERFVGEGTWEERTRS